MIPETYIIDRTGIQEEGLWKLIPYDKEKKVLYEGLVVITSEGDTSYEVIGERTE